MRSIFVGFTVAVGFAVAVGTIGCGDDAVGPSDVVARDWRLISIQQPGSGLVLVEDPSRYTLRLEENGRAAVKSDCNSCGGDYTLEGSSLELGPIVCTRAFCGEASLDPEYVRALEAAGTVLLDDSELILAGGGVTLRFSR